MAIEYRFARTALRTALIGITTTALLSACGSEDPATEIAAATTAPAATTSTAAIETTTPAAAVATTTAAPVKPVSTRASTTKPNVTKKPTTRSGVLSGTRQVVIAPVPSFESVLALNAKNVLSVIDGESSRSLFVFVPSGKQYLIKTAKAELGGEPSCLSIKTNGSASLTVVAAACNAASAAQLFTVSARGKTYAISNRSAYLQVFKGKLIAEELGDAPLTTTFKLVDNGKASLPALD